MDMYGEDDFLAAPGLGEAIMGNKIKSLLLMGAVYAAGAFVGKQKSKEALSMAGERLGDAASSARKFAADRALEYNRRKIPSEPSPIPQGSGYRMESGYPYYQR